MGCGASTNNYDTNINDYYIWRSSSGDEYYLYIHTLDVYKNTDLCYLGKIKRNMKIFIDGTVIYSSMNKDTSSSNEHVKQIIKKYQYQN